VPITNARCSETLETVVAEGSVEYRWFDTLGWRKLIYYCTHTQSFSSSWSLGVMQQFAFHPPKLSLQHLCVAS
jgi:uncharacterized protein YodC (DUF2158 family)